MAKIRITPGQALLILLKKYKSDKSKFKELKALYLSGADSARNLERIKHWFKDPILKEYGITIRRESINEDPTRRYFETHLAYESLREGLSKVSLSDLQLHFNALYEKLPANKQEKMQQILSGISNPQDDNLKKEYADYISKVQNKELFHELNEEDRNKVLLLAKCSLLGVINIQTYGAVLPLDIYNEGIYSEQNKGKKLLKEQNNTQNQNLGLMKGHMPTASSDIARGEKPTPYLKPSDQATYVSGAQWVEDNFRRLVHPFSNSISGTMLCQLRWHAYFMRENRDNPFMRSAQSCIEYHRLFVSSMIFNSGGHSLHEFTAPLSLPKVVNEFKRIKDFDRISLRSIFLDGNDKAFDAALDKAIDYNDMLLQKRALHNDITRGLRSPKNKAQIYLNKAVIPIFFSHKIDAERQAYQTRIDSQVFSSQRSGSKKNELIKSAFQNISNAIQEGNFEQAWKLSSDLKQVIKEKFGENNLWGEKSESYKLVERIERSLNRAKGKLVENNSQLKTESTSDIITPPGK